GTMGGRDTLGSVASLAAGAAHEINNPLAVIMGQAQLLAEELEGAAHERLAEILEATDRIRAIVARMRPLTRGEVLEGSSTLPPLLDFPRSRQPRLEAAPAVVSLVIVARDGPARYESLYSRFAGPETEVIVDRRSGEQRRSGAEASGGRRHGDRRRRDISGELRARGWALVVRGAAPTLS